MWDSGSESTFIAVLVSRYDIECSCCKELQNGAENELEKSLQACKQQFKSSLFQSKYLMGGNKADCAL